MSTGFQSNIQAMTRATRLRAERLVQRTAFGIQAKMRAGMADAKSGHVYGDHQASAPGEMPAIDYGVYADSLQVEWSGLSAIVGTNQEQAEVLENGGVYMEPRPHFGPAFDAAIPEFERGLSEVFNV